MLAVELRAGDVTGWERGRKGKAASGDYVEFIAHNSGSTPDASIGGWKVVSALGYC